MDDKSNEITAIPEYCHSILNTYNLDIVGIMSKFFLFKENSDRTNG
ncbi:hypothetical protein [Nostoc sp.]